MVSGFDMEVIYYTRAQIFGLVERWIPMAYDKAHDDDIKYINTYLC